jgi:hypothetical protein
VKEWCINSAAVDSGSNSVLAGSEDGKLYRWYLPTNTFSQVLTLTPGVGEAYTPTLIGTDGKVYAINNATLFAVGAPVLAVTPGEPDAGIRLAAPRPNPFSTSATLGISLQRAARVTLDILDLSGRRVARLLDRELGAGEHPVVWSGVAQDGRRCATGMYVARLSSDAGVLTRRLVLAR